MRTSSSGPPCGGIAASAGAMVDRRERRGPADGSPPSPGAASPFIVISPVGRCRPGSAAVAKALAALPAVQESPSGPPARSTPSMLIKPTCGLHIALCRQTSRCSGTAERAGGPRSYIVAAFAAMHAVRHLQPAGRWSSAAWALPPHGVSRPHPTSGGVAAGPLDPAPALPACNANAHDEVLLKGRLMQSASRRRKWVAM